MHDIIAEKTLAAPIEKVWALVSDFSNLDWYGPALKVEKIASTNADRSGEIRRIHMPDMPNPVDEVLDSIDNATHTLRYHIPGTPMANYQVCVSLTANTDQSTYAKWHATFTEVTMDGLTPEMMIGMMEGTYSGMLDEIENATK